MGEGKEEINYDEVSCDQQKCSFKGISETDKRYRGKKRGDKEANAKQSNSRLTVKLARVMQVRERTRVQR